jgi:CRISPR-associated endonuclease Csn1
MDVVVDTVLGLDIGASSVGWALIELEDGNPVRILDGGSRIFPAGVEGDLASGRDEPRTIARTQARQARRQTFRRRQRKRQVWRRLQEGGLLPPTPDMKSATIDATLKKLDLTLYQLHVKEGDLRESQVLPYILRKKAATEPVDVATLGRAIYHLAQHRGFLSNRKGVDDEDERGKVKAGISELAGMIEASRESTLGAYFASIDPADRRIRTRWTARSMYEHEFDAIRAMQKPHHPSLSETFWARLRQDLYYQRPLKSQAHLIGKCSLEPHQTRAAASGLTPQRFRMLQTLNHLRVEESEATDRPLTAEERDTLLTELIEKGDQSMSQAKKAIALARTVKFTLERGGEKNIPGCRTNSHMLRLLGEIWIAMSDDEQSHFVETLESFEKNVPAERWIQKRTGVSSETAKELAGLRFEPGHANHSRKAMLTMMPILEQGKSYMEARQHAYPESLFSAEPQKQIPPVSRAIPGIRNPAVERALTEVRRLTNAIVREYGKPGFIRIELARDLKAGRKQRKATSDRNREIEKQRKDAKERLLIQAGLQNPSNRDIRKAILMDECGGICPYTGKPINWDSLFGPHPQFDIEHIIPASCGGENAFPNLTLCFNEENREVKRNKTPWKAYGGTPKWDQILDRVARFSGDMAKAKHKRFTNDLPHDDLLDRFTDRQMNDTRHSSKLAMQLVGVLYGGTVDAAGTLRVQATAGRATATLRRLWGLENLLGEGGKTRSDHRHHFVDALVTALTTPAAVRSIAQAAEHASNAGERRLHVDVAPPWESLRNDAEDQIDLMFASHRVDRRLQGALHQETNYSPLRSELGARDDTGTWRHIRKPIAGLSTSEVDQIVDAQVRKIIKEAIAESGKPANETFKDEPDHPVLVSKNGIAQPIHRVRTRKRQKAVSVGKKGHERHVAPGANHHMAIVGVLDQDGKVTKWEAHVVTLIEAVLRRKCGEPIVQKDWGEGRRFLFTMRSGDAIQLSLTDFEEPQVCIVNTVSGTQMEAKHSNDARTAAEIRKAGVAGGRMVFSMKKLFGLRADRVEVDQLGRIRRCHE